jgi:hypothetical protein
MAVTRQMTRDDAAQILGVEPTASNDEVMAAWRQQALQWHPDRNPDPNATSMMAKINMARDLMTGRQWRVMYETDRPGPGTSGGGYGPSQDFWDMYQDLWQRAQRAQQQREQQRGQHREEPEEPEEPEASPTGGQYYAKHKAVIDNGFENPIDDGPDLNRMRTRVRIPLGEGAAMSVVGGVGNYSHPKRALKNLNKYREVEMALIGPDGKIIHPERILGDDHPFTQWMSSADDVIPYIPVNAARDMIGYTIDVIKNSGWNPSPRRKRPWEEEDYDSDYHEGDESSPSAKYYEKYKDVIDEGFRYSKAVPSRLARGKKSSKATFEVGNVKVDVYTSAPSPYYGDPEFVTFEGHPDSRYVYVEITAGGSPVAINDILDKYTSWVNTKGPGTYYEPFGAVKNMIGELMDHFAI